MGIGGSYLGNKVLFDVQCGAYWNELTKEERNGFPQVYFSGNNIDPRSTGDLIHHLEDESKILKYHEKRNLKVLLLVISNFMVVYDALQKYPGIDVEVIAVTDPNMEKQTLLKKLAIEKGWPQFAVPDGVGGRFTVFTEVGLTLAA